MALTWKDLTTTGLAVLVGAFAYLYLNGFNFPFITGYRGAMLVLLALGIGMCALSSAGPNMSSPWIGVASILGVASLVLIILGLISGTKILFLATTGVILLLWALATLRHAVGG